MSKFDPKMPRRSSVPCARAPTDIPSSATRRPSGVPWQWSGSGSPPRPPAAGVFALSRSSAGKGGAERYADLRWEEEEEEKKKKKKKKKKGCGRRKQVCRYVAGGGFRKRHDRTSPNIVTRSLATRSGQAKFTGGETKPASSLTCTQPSRVLPCA